MAIFEEESNASQDGNYREHLNRNWRNGNTEFADLRRLINGVYTSISSLWDAITGWTQQVNDLKQKHDEDVDALTGRINELTETIKKQDARISKLENAVFGYGEYEVNYETPPKIIDHVLEINTDSNPKLKGE